MISKDNTITSNKNKLEFIFNDPIKTFSQTPCNQIHLTSISRHLQSFPNTPQRETQPFITKNQTSQTNWSLTLSLTKLINKTEHEVIEVEPWGESQRDFVKKCKIKNK